jgi:hypothetical protein
MVTFPMSKIFQIVQGDNFKHKEQLYFLSNFKFSQDFKLQILEQIQIWIFPEF